MIFPNWERFSHLFELESKLFYSEEYPYFVQKIGEERHQDLIALIHNNNLQEYQNDLLYIAYMLDNVGFWGVIGKGQEAFKRAFKKELSNAMEIINSSNINNIEIIVRDKAFKKKAAISNQRIIYKFIEWFKEFNKKTDIQPESLNNPKGKKSIHDKLGLFAHIIQGYLQEKTYMKAKKGIYISDRQAEFIYCFLLYVGILKDKDKTDMGYIRKYLIRYRKNKA